jgi:glycine oxidase
VSCDLFDVILVGQGLAGTTLGWHLVEAGKRVLIMDACEPVTSSKVAAGLITPITGQRLVLTARCDEFLKAARAFYTRIERRTGKTFFHDRVAIRLFKSDDERKNWSVRGQRPEYQAHLLDPQPAPLLDPGLGESDGGGFAMHSAQLDVALYLGASRAVLQWEPMTLDWRHDVTIGSDYISVGGHRARCLVSCEGYAAARNPYFSWVPFNPAKGDILTIRFHCPVPPHCLHRGIWLAPTGKPDIFRVGSTYDWENLEQTPSVSARQEIERKLKEFFRVPFTVLDHHAAVRPIITQSMALVGMHPEHAQLGYFNGLGSKGSLHAPWYAERLADHLVNQTPLPGEIDIGQHFEP